MSTTKPEPATPAEHAPAPSPTPRSELATQLRSFAAGGFGGVCAVVVGHPFDLVKVRMQTAERGVYKSAIDVVRKSVARDGLKRGLYAGVSAPLIGVTPMCMFFAPLISVFPKRGERRRERGDAEKRRYGDRHRKDEA
ncbi:MC/SLC25 family protein [Candidatus Bathyarchaeota archaeon]|nr:MC/SLC25 family protein [Candidatus Bathyarchaeota archaeon]